MSAGIPNVCLEIEWISSSLSKISGMAIDAFSPEVFVDMEYTSKLTNDSVSSVMFVIL
ncbi:unnamed protein product [Protopolystoma xenopodis]|uniref:Uncharacterized protein n=1 Tax=Protopolystoma xenopodis TaxID=117903 RepID=A0A3S5BHW8_9PLAT|nr:unnamed protein product [Protopolystoma xenopodis]